MTPVIVPCAVCAGTSFDPLYPGTIDRAEDDPGLYFSSSRIKGGHFPIVRCRRCGLVMSNPQDDDITRREIYAGLVAGAYTSEERTAAREHLDWIGAHCSSPGDLLDIGCASGIFVGAAQGHGWRATGLEASERMLTRARGECPHARFDVGRVEDVDYPPGTFDVVTMWDVLEHVTSPIEALRRAHRWTAPGGWLFLSLPNADSLSARLTRSRWVLLLREHLWYFSKRTLGMLLAQAGFELGHVQAKSVRFSLEQGLCRVAQYRGALASLAAGLSHLPRVNQVSVRLFMGEVRVAARRLSR